MKKNKGLKFNKNGTVDIPAGEYNLKDEFSIVKFLQRLFCWHKYKSIGVIELSSGEFSNKKKIKGRKIEHLVCLKCNKLKTKLVK